ncbi:MAG: hypothetical protein MHM6MM_004696 [Cercozoa sp. M6MM]
MKRPGMRRRLLRLPALFLKYRHRYQVSRNGVAPLFSDSSKNDTTSASFARVTLLALADACRRMLDAPILRTSDLDVDAAFREEEAERVPQRINLMETQSSSDDDCSSESDDDICVTSCVSCTAVHNSEEIAAMLKKTPNHAFLDGSMSEACLGAARDLLRYRLDTAGLRMSWVSKDAALIGRLLRQAQPSWLLATDVWRPVLRMCAMASAVLHDSLGEVALRVAIQWPGSVVRSSKLLVEWMSHLCRAPALMHGEAAELLRLSPTNGTRNADSSSSRGHSNGAFAAVMRGRRRDGAYAWRK